jgi:hypothetical protein
VSNHLEQIVRPSQTLSLRPASPTQIFATPKIPVNNPVVWGSSGDSIFDLHAHSSGSSNNKWPESERTFDVVRVFNPDDHDQFIDTEVMTEYQGRNKLSQERITMQFASQTSSPHTEVISSGNKRSAPGQN